MHASCITIREKYASKFLRLRHRLYFYMYCVKVTQIFIERVNILFCGCWEALCRSYMSPVVKIKINKCDGYGSGIAPMLDDHYHGVILILNILQYYK